MKLKNIIILTLIALLFASYSAEAKKKQKKISVPVVKMNVKGFDEPLIEIDQQTIDIDVINYVATVRFKKVADFPHNYVPRLEELKIESPGDDENGIPVQLSIDFFRPSDVKRKLNELINQPVGSTVEVKLEAYCSDTPEDIARAKKEGAGITLLTIIDQAKYNEAIDFAVKISKIITSNGNTIPSDMIYKGYVYPSGDSASLRYYDVSENTFSPIEEEYMKKVTREKLSKGSIIFKQSKKENLLVYMELCYNSFVDAFAWRFTSTYMKYIEDDDTCGEGYAGIIFFKKINGKFMIVDLMAAG